MADLSHEKAAAQVKATVETRELHIDMLINNAGMGTYDVFEKLDPERDHQLVMLNVTAVVDLAHAFLPEMAARGEGDMINVSSMAAYMPMPYMAVYAASKAFVLSFSEALWVEYHQRGIQVTALCPGQVETAFSGASRRDACLLGSIRQIWRSGLAALRPEAARDHEFQCSIRGRR